MEKRYTYYYQLLVQDDSGPKNAEAQVGQKPGVFECLKKSMGKKAPGGMTSEEYKTMVANGRGYDARLSNS